MFPSVIDSDSEQKHSIAPLAQIVNQFVVSYENVERYPNPVVIQSSVTALQSKISRMLEWEEISTDEINALFSK